MTMVFCTRCGAEDASDDSFCRKCGAPRSNAMATEPKAAKRAIPRWAKLVLGTLGGLIAFVLMITALSMAEFALVAWIAALSQAEPQSDPAVLKSLCETVAKEDADNNGITAAGTPWNLNDLTVDASIQYGLEKFKTLPVDLPRAGAVLRETLRAQSGDESIEQLCQANGHPISTANASKDRSVTETIAALEHSVRLPPQGD